MDEQSGERNADKWTTKEEAKDRRQRKTVKIRRREMEEERRDTGTEIARVREEENKEPAERS